MKNIKITPSNYFSTIEKIGFENLPLVLKQSHTVILTKTDNGEDWSKYKSDTDLKRMIDLVFKKVEEFMESKQKPVNGITDNENLDGNYLTPKDVAINLIKPSILRGDTMDLLPSNKLHFNNHDYSAHIEDERVVVTMLYGTDISESFLVKDLLKEIISEHFKSINNTHETIAPRKKRLVYNHKQPEFKIIKAILNWENRTIYKNQVENFLNELQGYITSKQITKQSPVATEIKMIQDKLLHIYNNNDEYTLIRLSKETKKTLQEALKKVTDVGKSNPLKNKGLDGVFGINKINEEQILPIQQMIEDKTEPKMEAPKIMTSIDFTALKFNTIGFKDKWLKFIGDPAQGFTAMVFGMPKMGKSYLCIDFAGYLAKNHGKVLYVAKEEKLDKTLQDKLNDKHVAHENLILADALPSDLSAYDFIFIDSVNKQGLTAKDLIKLKADNKGKSFIYVFQATKSGQFKGNNEFQHDVDIVIEIPERGKAIQYGRFNQGGEMQIFDTAFTGEDDLSGIRKVKKKSLLNRLR